MLTILTQNPSPLGSLQPKRHEVSELLGYCGMRKDVVALKAWSLEKRPQRFCCADLH